MSLTPEQVARARRVRRAARTLADGARTAAAYAEARAILSRQLTEPFLVALIDAALANETRPGEGD